MSCYCLPTSIASVVRGKHASYSICLSPCVLNLVDSNFQFEFSQFYIEKSPLTSLPLLMFEFFDLSFEPAII